MVTGLGHAAGDELLRQGPTARAPPSDLVARLSGDRIAVLLQGVQTGSGTTDVAEPIVAALAAPFRVDGLDLRVTTSVGVAVHIGLETSADALPRAADRAMYVAERALRSAVAGNGLRLHFQRLVHLRTDRRR